MAADAPGVYDATDDVYLNNLRSEEARRRREDEQVLRELMASKQGRSWMYRFLAKLNTLSTPFHGEETHKTAFAIGQQEIGRFLFLELTAADLMLYMAMLREAKEEEARQEKELQRRNVKAEGSDDPPLTPEAQGPHLTNASKGFVDHLNPPPGWPGHVPPQPAPTVPGRPDGGTPQL